MTSSIKDIQKRYGVGEHTVLGWIRRGELRAINVCRTGSSRPKWRITEQALEAFEENRTPTPPPPRTRRRKRDAEIAFK